MKPHFAAMIAKAFEQNLFLTVYYAGPSYVQGFVGTWDESANTVTLYRADSHKMTQCAPVSREKYEVTVVDLGAVVAIRVVDTFTPGGSDQHGETWDDWFPDPSVVNATVSGRPGRVQP